MADDFNPANVVEEELLKSEGLKFKDLKSKDGIVTRGGGQSQSLLHRVISVGKLEEELKTALWRSEQEPDKAVAAYYQLYRLGLDTKPVELTIIARSAGKNHELLRDVFKTIQRTEFITGTDKEDKKHGRNRKTSPLET